MTISEALTTAMAERSVGPRRLAKVSGIDRRVIQRILAGKNEPRLGVLEKIVAALDEV